MARHFKPAEFTPPPKRRSPLPLIGMLLAVLAVAALAFLVIRPLLSAAPEQGDPAQTEHEVAVVQDEQQTTPEVTEPVITEEAAPAEPDTSTLAGLLEAREVSSIRVLGDSISAGYLLDGYDNPSDTDVLVYEGGEGTFYEKPTTLASWTNSFRTYAAEHGVETFVNAAVSGFRMQYLAEDPAAWIREGADVIVVMLGTNDASKVSVEEFRSYAEQALTACEESCKHLVVVSPPNNERTDSYNLYGMDQIDQVLAELSEAHGWEHISLLDALEVGSADFFEDQVHPTATGSANLWEAFRGRLMLPA